MCSKYQINFFINVHIKLCYYVLIQHSVVLCYAACSKRSSREMEVMMLRKGFKKNFLSGLTTM